MPYCRYAQHEISAEHASEWLGFLTGSRAEERPPIQHAAEFARAELKAASEQWQ